jgi:phage-related minor tail protein
MAQQLAQYEMRVATSGEQPSSECAQLEAAIADLDRAARMPQTGFEQDRLSAAKRHARDRQFRLRCA